MYCSVIGRKSYNPQKDNGATVIEWEDRYKHRLDSSSTTPGFILVDPTQYPLILASRHVSLGFPFVNWAFARACIESEINPTAFISDARKRLLFMKDWDGTRWKFYLHPEFPNSRIRALKVSIEVTANLPSDDMLKVFLGPCGCDSNAPKRRTNHHLPMWHPGTDECTICQ
jgi:hypothetical protein